MKMLIGVFILGLALNIQNAFAKDPNCVPLFVQTSGGYNSTAYYTDCNGMNQQFTLDVWGNKSVSARVGTKVRVEDITLYFGRLSSTRNVAYVDIPKEGMHILCTGATLTGQL